MADSLRLSLAGVTLELEAPASAHLREDSLWRLRRHYDPFLATCSLPPQGVALDIGAGFGAFALPFARRYPGWTIWCFEPGDAAFAALRANIARLGLRNVHACQLAVAEAGPASPDLTAALAAGQTDLARFCPDQPFRRHRRLDGFHDARRHEAPAFEPVRFPTLPAAALTALRPDLLKLVAPYAERGILRALAGTGLSGLMGESWEILEPELTPASATRVWLPFARAPELGLRRTGSAAPTRLDVVIEVEDAAAPVAATLAAMPPEPGIALHLVLAPGVRLADPGRADVTLHEAGRAGSSAAFNLGRRQSRGSHLAFLRAGDRPAPGAWRALMQLADLSGAELVQGGGPEGPGWTDLPREGGFDLGGRGGAFVPGARLLADFAPSRARIWRRDFLDARRLWCPEHLAAFAGHHLHCQALPQLPNVPVLPDARLSPQPDPLLHDEGFHLPEVFRLALRQALAEGWRDLTPLLQAMATGARLTLLRLAPDRRGDFLDAMAEVQLMAEKALGAEVPQGLEAIMPGFADRMAQLRADCEALPGGYVWGWQDGPLLHPAMQAARDAWRKPD